MTIRRKLLLVYFIIAVIPVLVVSLYNYFSSVQTATTTIIKKTEDVLVEQAKKIERINEEMHDDLDMLSWNYDLLVFLDQWYEQNQFPADRALVTEKSVQKEAAEFINRQIEKSNLPYRSVTYYDTTGRQILYFDFVIEELTEGKIAVAINQEKNKILTTQEVFKRRQIQQKRFAELINMEATYEPNGVNTESLSIASLIMDEDEEEYIGMLIVEYSIPKILARTGVLTKHADDAVNIVFEFGTSSLLSTSFESQYKLEAKHFAYLAKTNDQSPNKPLLHDFQLEGLTGNWSFVMSNHPGMAISIGILRNMSDATKNWRKMSMNNTFILLTILAVSGLIIGILVSRMTNPIHTLAEAARNIAAGNLSQQIEVKSNDEIRTLAESFNTMSISLRETLSNLEELNSSLENRVQQRTKDLEEANDLIETQKRDLEMELTKAHDMQMQLMPDGAPIIPGFDLAGQCRPATHVGGDFFQYFSLPDGRISFVVADVTGHGMEAAIPTMVFSGLLGNQISYSDTPEHLYASLNNSLYSLLERRTFICFAMGELNIDQRSVRLCNSGCPYPYHYSGETGDVTEIRLDAFPLGLRENTAYSVSERYLAKGDRIVLCSDGIIEASDIHGEIFGFQGTANAIKQGCDTGLDTYQLIHHVFNMVSIHSGNSEQEDDQTIVVLHAIEA